MAGEYTGARRQGAAGDREGRPCPVEDKAAQRPQRMRRCSGKRSSRRIRWQTAGWHNCADGLGNSLASSFPWHGHDRCEQARSLADPVRQTPAARRNHRESARSMHAVRRKRECASAEPAWPKATKTVPLRQRNDVNRRAGVRLLPDLALQLMHKRVTGRALRRGTLMSSPQSSQIP